MGSSSIIFGVMAGGAIGIVVCTVLIFGYKMRHDDFRNDGLGGDGPDQNE